MRTMCTRLLWVWLFIITPLTAHAEVAAGLRARVLNETTVELTDGKVTRMVRKGERFDRWTLMALHLKKPAYAVLEEMKLDGGELVLIGERGPLAELQKTAESSEPKPSGYLLGLSEAALRKAPSDVLADKLLASGRDPDYAHVAPVFAPTQVIKSDTFDFLGGLETSEKVGFTYGGRSPSFDPAIYQASIANVQKARRVWHGLVGGYLPILRFVYPETEGTFTELIAFAPLRVINNNKMVQPVWFRLTRVEQSTVVWSKFVDTYQPLLPPTPPDPEKFYDDLLQLKSDWDSLLAPAMQLSLPDERVSNMAKLSLVRAMMTRVG
ncbi:MAG TPA: hypothetical protein VFN67_42065, partial [Polyangiales bacterium]|nr:hypothetical protein [Polyangiales bacterium]